MGSWDVKGRKDYSSDSVKANNIGKHSFKTRLDELN